MKKGVDKHDPLCYNIKRRRFGVPFLWRFGPVVQLVRTLACHARGRGFESHPGRQFASVAQLVEQGTENPRVVGSIPTGGTIADLAHLVERDLAKVEVAGSSPVIRSKHGYEDIRARFFFKN